MMGMETTIDSMGRVVLPKPLREALGLVAGQRLDVSAYGGGIQLLPRGRTAQLVEEDGVLVARGDEALDDEALFALIEAGRR